MTTIRRELGRRVTFPEVSEVLKNSFPKVFGIKLVEASLSSEEMNLASKLRKEKYGMPEWVFNRPSSWKG